MIYVVAVAFLTGAIGFYFRLRSNGFWSTILDTIAAAMLGWISGWLIGIGARVGMWSIPFFNGTEPRVTLDGTLRVIIVFSLYGIGFAIVYELFFRSLLRQRAFVYGLLITVVSSYPLASAAVQQLSFTPDLWPLVGLTLLIIGLMFLPFSLLLEFLLARWHEFRNAGAQYLSGLHTR
jgi:hypothetical protein